MNPIFIRVALLWSCLVPAVGCLGPVVDDSSGPGRKSGASTSGMSPSQASYQYAGCAAGDYNCPQLKTMYCAVETIRAHHDACNVASDCAVATGISWQCVGGGECPGQLINTQSQAAFRAELQPELDAYCFNATCIEGGNCGPVDLVPGCVQSRCTWVQAPQYSAVDAGLGG
jgi:hypothetical protein